MIDKLTMNEIIDVMQSIAIILLAAERILIMKEIKKKLDK